LIFQKSSTDQQGDFLKCLFDILADYCHTVFQVASFAKWIKCTQKNAMGGKLSQKGIKQACDKPGIEKTFPPKCEQKIFFENGY